MVTIEQLYKALRTHGCTTIQAAGIVGNSVSEVGPSTPDLSPDSELNPEYDEPGCIGLWCWEPVYFDPPRPTGDDIADMNNQIVYLEKTGGFEHAVGADATSAGRNFALNYERCAECMVGGLQYERRGEQAASVAALAEKYDWDKPPAPPKSMHYDWYPKTMRTAAERYDANRKIPEDKRTATEKKDLAERRAECKKHAEEIRTEAFKHAKNKKPDWLVIPHGGWLYQQLTARGDGKEIHPS
jgi:hypothetical protein